MQFHRLPARAALFPEGTPAEAIHVVRSGSFKSSRTDADDCECLLGFARRSDALGYSALGLCHHTAAAVTLFAWSNLWMVRKKLMAMAAVVCPQAA